MRRSVRVAVVVAAAAAVLAGCSSGDTSDSSTESRAAGGSVGNDQAAPAVAEGDQGAAPDPAAVRTVRTGDITVEVRNLSAAATAVRGAATAQGGFVASESTGIDGTEDGTGGVSTLVLRVPEPKTEQLIEAIVRTGELVNRSTNAEDVTAAVADVDSRVATQTRSLERVRALLGRATSINDVVMLESELAKRETELEALQARQRSLNDRADLATITATLRLPDAGAEDDLGFLAGLEGGWTAFLGALVVGLTVLGAILPFAVPLALLAFAVWFARKRLHRPASATPATPRSP